MEESKKKISIENDKDIIFTKAIKAGKRIYYLDVKRNRKDELYLAITESKKVYNADDTKVTFEKHKIFLYQEDFEKFSGGLNDALDYIRLNQSIPEHQPRYPEKDETSTNFETNGEAPEKTDGNGTEQETSPKKSDVSPEEKDQTSDSNPAEAKKEDEGDLNITF